MPGRNPLVVLDRGRFQPLLLGIGFAILVAISVATVFIIDRATDDANDLNRTLLIQDRLSNVLLAMRRAESGQRGYVITRNPEYLADYEAGAPRVPAVIGELHDLARDDVGLNALLPQIEELSKTKLDEMARTVDLTKRGDYAEAMRIVESGLGRNAMDDLRKVVVGALAEQVEVRNQRTVATQRNNIVLLTLTLVGSLLIVIIGGLSVFLVRRNARRAEIARQELAGTNANLERIVEYRTADLTEANEEIQRFAYIVSHDLRSPLVNIMGFTSELEALRQDIFAEIEKLRTEVATLSGQPAGPAPAVPEGDTSSQIGRDFDEAISFIKTSIANMDRLINAVLRLSREGRRQFHPEKVDMKDLIDGIIKTVSHRAAELQATLRVEEIPPVETDPLAAQQIFGNLIDNALKYGRDGEKLQIDIRGRLTPLHAIYEVQDNGRGIDPADFQRVFELFRRAGKQDRPGEGIGLAHVRALVRRMGGTMGLTSELGKGSTFIVTLPRRWAGDKRSAV